MTPQALGEVVRQALGTPPAMRAREGLGALMRGQAQEISLRYEEVRNWRPIEGLMSSEEVGIRDGQEWIVIFLQR